VGTTEEIIVHCQSVQRKSHMYVGGVKPATNHFSPDTLTQVTYDTVR